MLDFDSVLTRERSAVLAHRESLGGAALPRPADAPRGTFLHGFFLPFSLIGATLRDHDLRGPYLRILAVRLAVVVLLTAVGLTTGSPTRSKSHSRPTIVLHHDVGKKDTDKPGEGVHVHVPGVDVDIDDRAGKSKVVVLGQSLPVEEDGVLGEPEAEADAVADDPGPFARLAEEIGQGWARLLALLALISATSTFVIALSRRYDDWLSFFASRLASVAPEDPAPPKAKLAIDLKWLIKKIKRRIRGYVVFGAGVPLLALFQLVPTFGPWLFKIALMCWGWYWLGVFTAAKSAHAWVDDGNVPPPALIRGLNDVPKNLLTAPLRGYARLWARVTKAVYPPAAAFERAPAAFLGLALARAILSFPIAYLFARPIVPIAAGRLVAESDPGARFVALDEEAPSALAA